MSNDGRINEDESGASHDDAGDGGKMDPVTCSVNIGQTKNQILNNKSETDVIPNEEGSSMASYIPSTGQNINDRRNIGV